VLVRHKDYKAAVPLLLGALKINPKVRIAYLNLGIIYTAQKRYGDAVSTLKHAIQLDSAQADAHLRLSMAYQAMGDAREAEAQRKELERLQQKTRDDLLRKISGPPPLPPVE